jgi:hypothetical protein
MSNPFEELHAKLDLILEYLQNSKSKQVSTDKEWGGVAMACEITGYKPQTIYTKAGQKQIPHLKRDGRLWFKRSDLIEWIETGK